VNNLPADKHPARPPSKTREMASTVGWFVLGFACLASASAIADLAFAALAAVVESDRVSIWQSRPAVALAAFLAAIAAVTLTRRVPRLSSETLRATWAVAVIDLAISAASLVRGGAYAGVGLFEGLGFLVAAIVMTSSGRSAATTPRDRTPA